jgi:hypothetical protein
MRLNGQQAVMRKTTPRRRSQERCTQSWVVWPSPPTRSDTIRANESNHAQQHEAPDQPQHVQLHQSDTCTTAGGACLACLSVDATRAMKPAVQAYDRGGQMHDTRPCARELLRSFIAPWHRTLTSRWYLSLPPDSRDPTTRGRARADC